VEDDATIQHERAIKFDFHTGRRVGRLLPGRGHLLERRGQAGAQIRASLPAPDGARAPLVGRPRRVSDVQVRTRHGPDDLDPRGRVLAVAPHGTDEHASASSSLNVCSKALSPSTR
jgi:hypothetical protein